MSKFINYEKNTNLVVTNEESLKVYKKELLSRLKRGEHIYVFFDTETTGTEPFPKKSDNGKLKLRDRVIEVGMIFYGINEKGKLAPIVVNGEPVTFQEYINPAKESLADIKKFQAAIPVNDEYGIIEKYKNQTPQSYKPFELFVNIYLSAFPPAQAAKMKETIDGLRALLVHGTSLDFLEGKGFLGGEKLPKPAPSFNEVRQYIDDILCTDELTDEDITGKMIGIGHNSINFDNTFLNVEMERDDIQYNEIIDSPRTFDSVISDSKDTMNMMQELWTRDELKEHNKNGDFNVTDSFGMKMKPGYSMSYLAFILGVKEEGRENFHGALLDSEILAQCFIKLIEHPKYLNAPNKFPIPAPVHDFLNKKIDKNYLLPKLGLNSAREKDESVEKKVLTLVQTDASLQEGTGTIFEYISAAKEAGLTELAMIDICSMMSFVPFYEECKNNDIKPIIGVTLKLESMFDIEHYINVAKKNNSYDCVDFVTKKIFENLEMDYTGIDNMLSDSKSVKIPEIAEYFSAVGDLFEKIRDKKADSAQKTAETVLKTKLINLLTKSDVEFDIKALKDINKVDKLIIREIVSSINNYVIAEKFNRVDFYPDITLIANSDEGLQSLRYLITDTQRTGKYFLEGDKGLAKGEFPLTNIDLFADKSKTKGLTVLLGDSSDILGRAIKTRNNSGASSIINSFKNNFEDVVFDINSKMSKSEERLKKGEAQYMSMASLVLNSSDLVPIATHRVAFSGEGDYNAHLNKASILLDYKVDSLMARPKKYQGQFIQSNEQLQNMFSDNEYLMENTSKIISECNINPVLHNPSLPRFPTPNGEDETEYFLSQVKKGFDVKVKIAFDNFLEENGLTENNTSPEEISKHKKKLYDEYEERLAYELKIIIDMGFQGYFLITQDAIEYCKNMGVVIGAGRGSAAGSLVVYSLGITSINPIVHGLIFERFLNPERVEMPDIDTDLEDKELLMKYLESKYQQYGDGAAAAAYIITKGTFSAKSTIKAIGKTRKLPVQWQNKLASLIPHTPGITIEESLDENEKLQNRYQSEAMTKSVIDEAIELEKVHRQKSTGKHAGGVVVGNLVGIAPIDYEKGLPVVQYDKNNIEAAGAVKFDFLGLATLTVVNVAVKNIVKNYGVDELLKYGIKIEEQYVNFDAIKYTDKKAITLIQQAKTSNVFQIESAGMKSLVVKMVPKNLEEHSALLALFRPGPLESGMVDIYLEGKRDPENIQYLKDKNDADSQKFDTDFLEPILKSTYGAILYQEQVMKIAQVMAGYTLGGADKLRKAMGKKKPEEMAKQRDTFMSGAVIAGHTEECASFVFDKVEKFAGYGFNKSHSIAYADLTYKTALLKANYPKEFMAAVLTCDANGNDSVNKINKSIASARDVDVIVTPPDVNISHLDFRTTDKGVSYGLSGIKGATFDKLIEQREKNGKFSNMTDMLLRMSSKEASKGVMESLIESGAMDSLPLSERSALKNMDKLDSMLLKRAAKRILLMSEYDILKVALSSDKKRKDFVVKLKEETLVVNYEKAMNKVMENKSDANQANLEEVFLKLSEYPKQESLMTSLFNRGSFKSLKSLDTLEMKESYFDIDNLRQASKLSIEMTSQEILALDDGKYNVNGAAPKVKESAVFISEQLSSVYQMGLNRTLKDKNKSVKEMLRLESETLSAYVTGHPLDIGGMRDKLKDPRSYPILTDLGEMNELEEYKEGFKIKIAGVIKAGEFDLVGSGGGGYSRIILDDGTSDLPMMLFGSHTDIINSELKSKLGRNIQDGDIISIMAEFKKKENKRSGKEEMNMNIDFVEFPEFPEVGCIQVNSYAKPYRRKSESQYKP
jgi:DNA-directed DNA polymerase III PolC